MRGMLRFEDVTDETHALSGNESSESRRQLSLPLPGLIERPPEGMSIPRQDRVYANRNLRLGTIDWIGFDMDYTLAIYRQEAMDALSVRLTAERLVQRGYPTSLKELHFDTNFPIRGLLIDKKLGNILKMDRHKVINQGFHGTRKLTREELHHLYGKEKIRPSTTRFHWIDTLFALCEVTSFAAAVTALEEMGESFEPHQLFMDVRAAIDFAHADGTVYRNVTTNLPLYIDRDPELPRTLHKLRSSGKRLFLLTNSPFHYTDTVMDYLLGGSEERYGHWTQYFDAVVCSAKKPGWFQPHPSKWPLFKKRIEGLDPVSPATQEVEKPFERGVVYEGGCLQEFERHFNLAGHNVLYVGDHIYGDILRSKKDSNWRTALVVQELDQEIRALKYSDSLRIRRRQLAEARPFFEDELRYYAAKFKEIARITTVQLPGDKLRKELAQAHIDRVRTELTKLEHEYSEIEERINSMFHPYWGSMLKEMNGLSIFGQQVDQYADIYMRRVSCLGAYSPTQFFRSPHDLMPHEI